MRAEAHGLVDSGEPLGGERVEHAVVEHARRVEDGLDVVLGEQRREGVPVGKVAGHDRRAQLGREFGRTGAFGPRTADQQQVAGVLVVQPAGDPAADGPGAAGDQDGALPDASRARPGVGVAFSIRRTRTPSESMEIWSSPRGSASRSASRSGEPVRSTRPPQRAGCSRAAATAEALVTTACSGSVAAFLVDAPERGLDPGVAELLDEG